MPRSFWVEFTDAELETIQDAARRSEEKMANQGLGGDPWLARLLEQTNREIKERKGRSIQ